MLSAEPTKLRKSWILDQPFQNLAFSTHTHCYSCVQTEAGESLLHYTSFTCYQLPNAHVWHLSVFCVSPYCQFFASVPQLSSGICSCWSLLLSSFIVLLSESPHYKEQHRCRALADLSSSQAIIVSFWSAAARPGLTLSLTGYLQSLSVPNSTYLSSRAATDLLPCSPCLAVL